MRATDGYTGIRRLLRASRVGVRALHWGMHNEEAIRLELLALIPGIPVAIWLGHTGMARAFLISSLLLVLVTELLNTGIEIAVDRIGKERHELSGLAKDLGSAAVMIALLNAVLVWCLVLI
ncbi:MAG: diacylglycerol kinase [Gammaproteobacteria bacterium]|nr:diacylglycerol kinase [Gammaproteobacteria bacterium]MDE2345382.1 diacylglycerol kinase [Gammaproteobacteria bacterium]